MPTFRRYIVAGLLVWVPLGVTVMVVKFLIDLMDRLLLLIPYDYRPEVVLGVNIPGLGVLLALLIVIVTGVVVANLFGRQIIKIWENFLARIPLVRSIYSSVKQVTETIFSSQGNSFRQVVMIEYPRSGIWTLAFVTGEGIKAFEDKIGESLLNIFVPTTPNPTSGFFLMVRREDAIALDIPVEVALKMIISTGVVVPEDLLLSSNADSV
ncbi:DUF502 domain-containing protein [Pseudomonadota bacterium]